MESEAHVEAEGVAHALVDGERVAVRLPVPHALPDGDSEGESEGETVTE